MVNKLEYFKTYQQRAEDAYEERCDTSRRSRIPFFFRYCLPSINVGWVLDVGSADGVIVKRYGQNGIGCDIAKTYCLKMRKGGIQSVCCDAEHLPFRNNSFDLVIVSAVLEHVLNPKHVVSEVIRILHNDGYCFISVPYKEDLARYSHHKYKFSHLWSFDDQRILAMFTSKFSQRAIHLHDFALFVRKISTLEPNNRTEIYSIEGAWVGKFLGQI